MKQNKNKTIIAIKKSQSFLAKIITMIEEDKYCIDIIQQNLAVIGLLKSANFHLLEGHVNHCVKNACQEKNSKKIDTMMEELLKVIKIAQNK